MSDSTETTEQVSTFRAANDLAQEMSNDQRETTSVTTLREIYDFPSLHGHSTRYRHHSHLLTSTQPILSSTLSTGSLLYKTTHWQVCLPLGSLMPQRGHLCRSACQNVPHQAASSSSPSLPPPALPPAPTSLRDDILRLPSPYWPASPPALDPVTSSLFSLLSSTFEKRRGDDSLVWDGLGWSRFRRHLHRNAVIDKIFGPPFHNLSPDPCGDLKRFQPGLPQKTTIGERQVC